MSVHHQTDSHPDPASINIWLVDDNRVLREAVADLLATCSGVRCSAQFHSPNAVLSALASRPGPDVILLDIQMGEASGLDAIRPIKALSRATQVLMLTTCFDVESRRKALTNGASDFLLKHFSIEKVLSAIQKAVQHPAPHLKQLRRQQWVAPASDAAGTAPRRPVLWIKNYLQKLQLARS